jgi:hypothetical protein
MWDWVRGKGKSKPEPPKLELKGAPPHARTKTYSAETGHVYQYLYKGYRDTEQLQGVEFVFDASRDRAARFPIIIRLLDSNIATCESRIRRKVLSPERYALAKMTLFSAFDRLSEPGEFTEALTPDPGFMEDTLRRLGRIE